MHSGWSILSHLIHTLVQWIQKYLNSLLCASNSDLKCRPIAIRLSLPHTISCLVRCSSKCFEMALWLNLITPFRPPDFPTQKQYPTLKGSLQNLQSIFLFSKEIYSLRKESYLYIAIGSAQYKSKTNEIITNFFCTILYGRFQNFQNDISSSGELNISS